MTATQLAHGSKINLPGQTHGVAADPHEMFEVLPFPYPSGTFPAALGAVVQRTLLDGREPAREVVHTTEGSWLVGDCVNDPNAPGACVVTHMHHVIEWNSSIAALASMTPGSIATRVEGGQPWIVAPWEGWDEDE